MGGAPIRARHECPVAPRPRARPMRGAPGGPLFSASTLSAHRIPGSGGWAPQPKVTSVEEHSKLCFTS